MKLDDKQKKWMIIGGAVIVCMILVLLIVGQFKSCLLYTSSTGPQQNISHKDIKSSPKRE